MSLGTYKQTCLGRLEDMIRETWKERLEQQVRHSTRPRSQTKKFGFCLTFYLFSKIGHLVFSSYEKCFNSKYIFLINPDTIMKKTSVFPFILFRSKSQFDFLFRSLFSPNVKNT